jgi:hypothetical protein
MDKRMSSKAKRLCEEAMSKLYEAQGAENEFGIAYDIRIIIDKLQNLIDGGSC